MTDTTYATVAVLGAGIAQVCAMAGSSVVLQDLTDEFVQKGLGRIRDFLQKGVDKGKVPTAQRDDVLSRITTSTDRAAASRTADLVIEAVPEKLELKNGLFRELAGVVSPTCVLASNTSSLSLAKVFAGVAGLELQEGSAAARVWEAERACKRTGTPAETVCRSVVLGLAQRAAQLRRR